MAKCCILWAVFVNVAKRLLKAFIVRLNTSALSGNTIFQVFGKSKIAIFKCKMQWFLVELGTFFAIVQSESR